MAKKSTTSIGAILNKQSIDSLKRIEIATETASNINEDQLKTLKDIEHTIKTSRLIEGLQLIEENKIQHDEDSSLKETKDLNKNLKNISKSISTAIEKSLLPSLDKNQKEVVEKIAFNIKTYKSIGDKFNDSIKSIKSIPEKLSPSKILNTLGVVKSGSGSIVSNALDKLNDRNQFIKDQRLLGSDKSTKELKSDYSNRYKLAKQLKSNDSKLEQFRNMGLSEDQIANTKIGKGLLDKKESLLGEFGKYDIKSKIQSDSPAIVSTKETDTEQQRVVSAEADTLKRIEENTRHGKPEQVKDKEKDNSLLSSSLLIGGIVSAVKFGMSTIGTLLGGILSPIAAIISRIALTLGMKGVSTAIGTAKSAMDMSKLSTVPDEPNKSKSAKPKSAMDMSKLSTVEKVAKPSLLSKGAAVVGAIAAPIGIGLAVGEALHEGAVAYSDTFGEGGFDLIQGLRKKGILKFNGPFELGTHLQIANPVELAKLPKSDIETLINTGKFESPEIETLQKLSIENPAINSSSPNIPEEPGKVVPETIAPTTANAIYSKSNENAEAKENKSSGGNTVISAPTVNTSNKTVQNQSVKLPTRNTETTSNRYISSRYAVQ